MHKKWNSNPLVNIFYNIFIRYGSRFFNAQYSCITINIHTCFLQCRIKGGTNYLYIELERVLNYLGWVR